MTRRFLKVTGLAVLGVFLTQAGTITDAIFTGQLPLVAHDLAIAVSTGVAAAVQKGYAWNDPAPTNNQQFPEVPE